MKRLMMTNENLSAAPLEIVDFQNFVKDIWVVQALQKVRQLIWCKKVTGPLESVLTFTEYLEMLSGF